MLHDTRLHARIGCPACEQDAFARNTWFDGKYVTAADLVAEQDYFLSKHRRHDRLLHGWGVVCGLRVRQHPNPACQTQYVVVEPGSAVDCCGREVRIDQPTLFDFRAAFLAAWQAQNGKNAPPDAAAHRVEIVLRYAECPAEPVPVIFEGCAPSGESCLPNRVVEGFELSVLLDPPPPDPDGGGISLNWNATIGADGAMRVAVDATTGHAFVLAAEPGATVLEADLATGAILGAMADAAFVPLDIAVAADGKHVFLAVAPKAGGDAEIRVLDATNLAAQPLHTLPLVNAGGTQVHLAALADGRLAASIGATKHVLVWGADVTGTPPPAAPTAVTITGTPGGLALPQPATHLYVAITDTAEVDAIRLADLTLIALPLGAAGHGAIAAARHDGKDLLAVLEGSSVIFAEAAPDAATAADRITVLGNPASGFAQSPVSVALSPGGTWFAALLKAVDGSGSVQPGSVARIAAKAAGVLGAAFAIGPGPVSLTTSADGV